MNTIHKICRYGSMTFLSNDTGIGRSLEEYGEWSQQEIEFLLDLLDPGSVALDVGAFIGTHTLAFSKRVAENGKVYSFEPRSEFFSCLKQNVTENNIVNVELFHAGVSDVPGYIDLSPIVTENLVNFGGAKLAISESPGEKYERTTVTTIDGMSLSRCNLIKIDTEGMEPRVIQGARKTIERLRPIIYAECVSVELGQQILSLIRPFQYAAFLHVTDVYNPSNYLGNPLDVFYGGGVTSSLALVPQERIPEFQSRHRKQGELIPILTADDLALGLLRVPFFKYEVLAKTEAANVTGVKFFAIELELKGERTRNELELKGERSRREASETCLRQVCSSRSWRLTYPLRKGMSVAGSIISRLQQLKLAKRRKAIKDCLQGSVTLRPFSGKGLLSCQCTQAQLESAEFQEWGGRMKHGIKGLHRKVWEFCYIAQALNERDMLRLGRRGLGFGVGEEPLASLFASYGCEIVATDLSTEEAAAEGWIKTNQHAASLEALNKRGLCSEQQFRNNVSFRFLDMRKLPDDLGTFDFIYSSCSLEHLGTIKFGEQFIYESLKYLRPGGIAVHTTEYNLSSNSDTVTRGSVVLFRKKDLERIVRQLRLKGYHITIDFSRGDSPADQFVDPPPYLNQGKIHLRLEVAGYVVTSFGLIIERAK